MCRSFTQLIGDLNELRCKDYGDEARGAHRYQTHAPVPLAVDLLYNLSMKSNQWRSSLRIRRGRPVSNEVRMDQVEDEFRVAVAVLRRGHGRHRPPKSCPGPLNLFHGNLCLTFPRV